MFRVAGKHLEVVSLSLMCSYSYLSLLKLAIRQEISCRANSREMVHIFTMMKVTKSRELLTFHFFTTFYLYILIIQSIPSSQSLDIKGESTLRSRKKAIVRNFF